MSDKKLTISVVAKNAGTGIETLRYYQRIGLIEEPRKPNSGYRVYPKETISRLKFIQRAKELGFSLSEISTLLVLGDGRCVETKEIASHKLTIIKNKISDLQAIESTLEELINSCERNPSHQGCPIITAISEE
ncbi:MAG: MerR family transcriptional regulator [Thiotrichales bacterium]|nr:MerR family transcriptional regulator [Thiotrichales bacterium]